MAEEVKELVMRFKCLQGCVLESVKGNVCRAQIERRDADIRSGEHVQKVAASRGDCEDMLTVLEAKRLYVHLGVLPDLGIDKMIKQGREETILQSQALLRVGIA